MSAVKLPTKDIGSSQFYSRIRDLDPLGIIIPIQENYGAQGGRPCGGPCGMPYKSNTCPCNGAIYDEGREDD